MAMWFAHVYYADAVLGMLSNPPDRNSFVWGSLCPDVDKVSEVPRQQSHYGNTSLPFPPEDFLDVVGITPQQARMRLGFVSGYLSHLAVDDAWYRSLFSLREAEPKHLQGWTIETTRALTLYLDMGFRSRMDLGDLDIRCAQGQELFPFLAGDPASTMRQVASLYLRWNGSLSHEQRDPLGRSWTRRFRRILSSQYDMMMKVLERLDRPRLERDVLEEAVDSTRRFMSVVQGRQ